MRRFSHRSSYLSFFALALTFSARAAHAQIATDGTLGSARTLSGPNYDIPAELGKIFGHNLFHSFRDFNLARGESATFSGPASITNILSRITGGKPSSIDGNLNSTIKGANFFFINPSGIVFGPDAQVNVGGSFLATTSDFVGLKGGGVFSALNPAATILTSAPPVSFGFLSPNPAPIRVDGSQLGVGTTKALSLIGSNLQLRDALLLAASGKINLISVGSAGQVLLNAGSPRARPSLLGFTNLGRISMDDSIVDVGDDPAVSAGTGPGGSVSLTAKDLFLDNGSAIQSANLGATSGGTIAIHLDGNLQISDESGFFASNEGSGKGTQIIVQAKNVTMLGSTGIGPHDLTGIQTGNSETGSGPGGGIKLECENLVLSNGAIISTNTQGSGKGGNISIKAGNIVFDGTTSPDFTGVAAQTFSEFDGGKGGSINITAKNLRVVSGAEVSTSTFGTGAGGNVTLNVDRIALDGQGSTFFTGIAAATSMQGGGGKGGNIRIAGKSLQIANGSQINADTEGSGNGGNVAVKVDNVLLDGSDTRDDTGIVAGTISQTGGKGGSITVDAKTLTIVNGAQISANTSGSGAGGNITINADSVVLDGKTKQRRNDLTGISANTTSEFASGQGGIIAVNAKNLQVLNGATITAFTTGVANGGDIVVHSDNTLLDSQDSTHFTGLSTQTAADTGTDQSGGHVSVTGQNLRIVNGAQISSSTFGSGAGGDVVINVDKIVLDGQGNGFFTGIDAGTFGLNRAGQGGGINIHAKTLQLLNGATIRADTTGNGSGGSITIRTDSTLIDGQNQVTSILANSQSSVGGTGQSGDIKIESGTITVLRGGQISASTLGQGKGGNILLKANTIQLDRQGSAASTAVAAETSGAGNGGNIRIQAQNLNIVNGAEVSANTFASGDGGNIKVEATNVTLDNQSSANSTAITAGTKAARGGGQGGNIEIHGSHLKIANKAIISTSSLGSGAGGDILVKTGDLTLDQGAITSDAQGTGQAGSVTIKTRGDINLRNGSSLAVTSENSNGGAITVQTGGSLFVNNSSINAQASGDGGALNLVVGRLFQVQNGLLSARAGGNGGNITSQANSIIFDRSSVLASAIRGNGGNITVRSLVFLPSIETVIDASSQFGVAGNVAIESPNTNLGGSLITLPSNLLGAESYLSPRCDIRETGAVSSFTVEPMNGTPPEPGDLLPSALSVEKKRH